MMFIILVNNTSEIREKLTRQEIGANKAAKKEIKAEVKEPKFVFCSKCGTRYDENNGNCPSCGYRNQNSKIK